MNHKPVLLQETLTQLNLRKGEVVVDGTLGLGGHGKAILKAIGSAGKYYGFDLDIDNLTEAKKRLKEFSAQTNFFHDNFVHCHDRLHEEGIDQVDAILLDLGLSSPHIDDPSRGFSLQEDGPLDMRFDRQSNTLTAAQIVNTWPESDLKKIIYEYGEERYAPKIARLIVEQRKEKPFTVTSELVDLVGTIMKSSTDKRKVATRVFQALRIAVNQELEVREKVIPPLLSLLKSGGRLVIISYHSLEDRLVKRAFKKVARACICPPQVLQCECSGKTSFQILTKKPIVPFDSEIQENPRSRSAKLRAIKKI